ncbi:MAG TPA: hypothetical protein VIT91_10100 [Chthoniobacterales bacterium]
MPPASVPSPDRAERRFIGGFFIFLSLGLIAIASLNIVADPFRVFGTPRWMGVNDRTPDTIGFDRVAKPYQLLHQDARSLVFGSSTAHNGFLALESWDMGLPKPAYNYALLGASAHEIRLSLEQALRESPVEVVVLVADFFAYNAYYADNERFLAKRLDAASRRRWPGYMLEDLGTFMLGIDGIKYSWRTLFDSHAANLASPSASNAPKIASNVPIRVHFQNCERSYPSRWFPPPARRYDFVDASRHRDTLEDFKAMLRACSEQGVQLYIIIPPIHARFNEALVASGAWPNYEGWKRAIVSCADAQLGRIAAEKHPPRLELWDFSLFNQRTCESVPVSGAPLRWWHDSAHFTPEFGQSILAEVMQSTPRKRSQLGVRLVPTSVELDTHLAEVRSGLEKFRAIAPDEVLDVHDALGIATVTAQRSASR